MDEIEKGCRVDGGRWIGDGEEMMGGSGDHKWRGEGSRGNGVNELMRWSGNLRRTFNGRWGGHLM